MYPHPAKIDSHRDCANGNIVILVLSHYLARPYDYTVMRLHR